VLRVAASLSVDVGLRGWGWLCGWVLSAGGRRARGRRAGCGFVIWPTARTNLDYFDYSVVVGRLTDDPARRIASHFEVLHAFYVDMAVRRPAARVRMGTRVAHAHAPHPPGRRGCDLRACDRTARADNSQRATRDMGQRTSDMGQTTTRPTPYATDTAACNRQQTTYTMQRATCDRQRSVQQTADNVHHATCNVRQTPQHATDSRQHTPCNVQRATDNAACNRQQTTDTLQRATCDRRVRCLDRSASITCKS
jgi:hypothetical protein